MHRGGPGLRTALPEALCKAIGFQPISEKEAIKAIIAFSQSRVVSELWARRAKLNKALRLKKRGVIPAEEFFASLSWKNLRYKALHRHGGRCQCCGASPAEGAILHVDHIKPRSKYPELALEMDNLQVLCADCNVGKLNRDETDWRKPAENDPESKLKVVK